jgi:hypothetical protein
MPAAWRVSLAKDEMENVVTEWKAAGDAWINAKLKADQLEEDAKNLLAAVINQLEQALPTGAKISEAKLERMARGSLEYREYIKDMCIARAEALRKKVRFDALEKLFDARRSQKAFERETVKQGIFSHGG